MIPIHSKYSALIPIASARITKAMVLRLLFLPPRRQQAWEDTVEKVQLSLLGGITTKCITASYNDVRSFVLIYISSGMLDLVMAPLPLHATATFVFFKFHKAC